MPKSSYAECTGSSSDSQIQAEVSSANRENREVELSADQLTSLGHHKRPLTKVVRSFCLSCMGGDRAQVRKCTAVRCELYPYRLGRNVYTGRKGPRTNGAGVSEPHARSTFQDGRAAEPTNSGNGSSEGAES